MNNDHTAGDPVTKLARAAGSPPSTKPGKAKKYEKYPNANLDRPWAMRPGGMRPPEFYGPRNVSKLPDPRALAEASLQSLRRISARSTLEGARYAK